MGLTFSQYVRTTVGVELIAIEEFSYELFLNSFTDLVCASVVDLTPYRGKGCLTLDAGLPCYDRSWIRRTRENTQK